jgi:hypothetical protein
LFAIPLLPVRALAADFNVSVVSSPSLAYQINGQTEPTLTLTRGRTYTFALDSTVSAHPFNIKTVGGVTGATDDFNEGVTPSNDLSSGTLTFAVPADAPASLFYQCAIHSFMTGSIQVVAATAVPALGTLTAILLAFALGGVGPIVYRRRLQSVS